MVRAALLLPTSRLADLAMTPIYVREAENLAAGFGAVFPPLPGELLAGWGSASVSDSVTEAASNIAISEDFGVEPTRIELVTSSMPWMRSPS
jgi:hypothetical protein